MRAAPRRPPLLRSRAATPRALGRADGGASAVRQRARADHPKDGLEGPGGEGHGALGRVCDGTEGHRGRGVVALNKLTQLQALSK